MKDINILAMLLVVLVHPLPAADWPEYGHDQYNSNITNEKLAVPLTEVWRYTARHSPQPAWPPPAKADFWHEKPRLDPRVTYDRVYQVTVAGQHLFFASSADDKVYCLNANTGAKVWTFFTQGPNRVAPTFSGGRIYVGSDDGYMYCLNADNGDLVWKYRPTEDGRKLPGNGRIISNIPVRTGAIVQNKIVYYAAGLFPKEGVYLVALNAGTGHKVWQEKITRVAPQGYPVASQKEIFLPNSRSQPAGFDIRNGELLNSFKGPGGDYLTLTNGMLVYGTQDDGQLALKRLNARDPFDASLAGFKFIADNGIYYVASNSQLSAINKKEYLKILKKRNEIGRKIRTASDKLNELRKKRDQTEGDEKSSLNSQIDGLFTRLTDLGQKLEKLKGKEFLWTRRIDRPHAMIKAGDHIIIGAEGRIDVFGAADGDPVWSHSVDGRASCLAVAGGKLFVSTEAGTIYCFGSDARKGYTTLAKSSGGKAYPEEDSRLYAAAAERILAKTRISKGYCLVLDSDVGRLAYELAIRSDLKIIGVEKNRQKLARARRFLDRVGLYGTRITMLPGTLENQHFTDYFANLIVSDALLTEGRLPDANRELWQVLRPNGGTIYFGQLRKDKTLRAVDLREWADKAGLAKPKIESDQGIWLRVQRGALSGSGEWTHLYANPGNTAASNDRLVNDNTVTQWFGQPGPRSMVDRHHRTVSPLYKNDIVYIPGDNRILAADAYNGTLLWDVILPNFRRLAIPRDAGNMVITEEYLYAANEARCTGLHPLTGAKVLDFTMPQLIKGQTRYWGYLATVGDRLFGSARKPEAAYTLVSKQADYEIQWGDFKRIVTSDYLFSMDRFKGRVYWTYKDGVILNPTIAIGGNSIYFIESRNAEAKNDKDGLVTLQKLFADQSYLVALDLQSGKKRWEKPFDFSACQHIIFLSYADGTLVAVGSKNKNKQVWYDLFAFDAKDGQLLWHREQNNEAGIGGDHGEQIHHPVITNNKVYAEPYAYDLRTGKMIADWKLNRGGGGCGTISGSSTLLFFRAGNPAICNLAQTSQGKRINFVTRPGCWINIIPAGGLVLIPEASSGCTCNYPLQMSVAYRPTGEN